MTPLEKLIRNKICDNGSITIAEYIELASSHREFGYYNSTFPFGLKGDFITAPEISQVFGEIIGLWSAVAWQQAGKPTCFNLIELGPGRGSLMVDALRACQTVPGFLSAANLHLVETSPLLTKAQKSALAGFDVTWHESLDKVPCGPSIILANEFFDALPINQYLRTKNGWYCRNVGIDDQTEQLVFLLGDAIPPHNSIIPDNVRSAPIGSIFEHRPIGESIAIQIAARIAADGVAALIIDYGYVLQSAGDTLQAVRRHDTHEILCKPGTADLTAHVDFETLSTNATAAGVTAFGPITQRMFLLRLGIRPRSADLAAGKSSQQKSLIHSGYRRLTDAEGMGSLFKVIAFTDGRIGIPAGFEEAHDQ